MANPYEPPSTELLDRGSEPRRPLGVWVISLWYGLSAVSGLTITPLAMLGALPASQSQQAYFESLPITHLVQSLAASALTLAFAITFFRLRTISIPILFAVIAVGVVGTAISVTTESWREAVGQFGLVGVAVGWLILLLVLGYAHRLRSHGVLT